MNELYYLEGGGVRLVVDWNNVKEGGICIKLDINVILIPEPLYNHFYTIAKLFQQVEAQCISLYALAFTEGSNGTQRFERK